MTKIKVLHEGHKYVYPHNDLQQAAFHLKTAIETRLKNDDRKGIAYDCMACLTMLAFSFEANLNFFGHKFVADWEKDKKEWLSFYKKFDAVLSVFGMMRDPKVRPYSTIGTLKDFRDLIAHGKPDEDSFSNVKEMTQEEMDSLDYLRGKWEKYCTPENVFFAYGDVDEMWNALREKSGLDPYDIMTRGDSSFSLVARG